MKYMFTGKFHANVQATHPSTLEITCEDRLTPRGDCILLTSSTHDPRTLSEMCRENKSAVLCIITRFGSVCLRGTCTGRVSCELVLRKGKVIDERTFMVNVDKASSDVDRNLIKKARLWGSKAIVVLMVD